MNLRPMEVRDNPAVAQLIRASLEEFGLDKPGTVYFDSHLDHLADYYQHQERAAYFILEDEGQLVGCGGFAPVSDKIAELQKLYVTKNSRGKGYSSRLIKRIIQEARLAGYEQLYLETSTELTTAVAIYQHYGFTALQEPLSNAAGHPAMNIWMIKSLLSDEQMSVYSGRPKDIMTNILNTAKTTAETYEIGKNHLASVNISTFENVADPIIAQGIVQNLFFQSSITTIGDFYIGFKKAHYF